MIEQYDELFELVDEGSDSVSKPCTIIFTFWFNKLIVSKQFE